MDGLVGLLLPFLTFVGIYAILALGLNIQWGFTGQLNIGIAGFLAVGAYTSAILTSPPANGRIGGFDLPIIVGLAGAVLVSGVLAIGLGWIVTRLREVYLAIATIGTAEIIRLVLKNEDWLTNGVRGIAAIPRPFGGLTAGHGALAENAGVLVAVLLALGVVYWLSEAARLSPWGRVQRAIRENEPAASAMGKHVARFHLESFVVGSAIMGLGGGLLAHNYAFVSPEAFEPIYGTFLVWVMLICGGSGNNRGAILGAVLVWLIWSLSEEVSKLLPADMQTQAAAIRVLLIGVLLQVVLLTRRAGILPEPQPRAPKPSPG